MISGRNPNEFVDFAKTLQFAVCGMAQSADRTHEQAHPRKVMARMGISSQAEVASFHLQRRPLTKRRAWVARENVRKIEQILVIQRGDRSLDLRKARYGPRAIGSAAYGPCSEHGNPDSSAEDGVSAKKVRGRTNGIAPGGLRAVAVPSRCVSDNMSKGWASSLADSSTAS
jgi:hypothetical protein